MRKIGIVLLLLATSCNIIVNHHAESIAKDQIKKYWNNNSLISHGSEEINEVKVIKHVDSNFIVYASASMQNIMGANMKQYYLIKMAKTGQDQWSLPYNCITEFDTEPTADDIKQYEK
jgi:hypothetical protein